MILNIIRYTSQMPFWEAFTVSTIMTRLAFTFLMPWSQNWMSQDIPAFASAQKASGLPDT